MLPTVLEPLPPASSSPVLLVDAPVPPPVPIKLTLPFTVPILTVPPAFALTSTPLLLLPVAVLSPVPVRVMVPVPVVVNATLLPTAPATSWMPSA